jgi:hypothetical protein
MTTTFTVGTGSGRVGEAVSAGVGAIVEVEFEGATVGVKTGATEAALDEQATTRETTAIDAPNFEIQRSGLTGQRM